MDYCKLSQDQKETPEETEDGSLYLEFEED